MAEPAQPGPVALRRVPGIDAQSLIEHTRAALAEAGITDDDLSYVDDAYLARLEEAPGTGPSTERDPALIPPGGFQTEVWVYETVRAHSVTFLGGPYANAWYKQLTTDGRCLTGTTYQAQWVARRVIGRCGTTGPHKWEIRIRWWHPANT